MAYENGDFKSYGNYSALIKSKGISEEAAHQMTPKEHAAMVYEACEAEMLAADDCLTRTDKKILLYQLSQCQESLQWTHDQLRIKLNKLPTCHATDEKCTLCHAQLLRLCTMYVQSSEGIKESEEKLRRHDAFIMRDVFG
jgi:hypothetical protein